MAAVVAVLAVIALVGWRGPQRVDDVERGGQISFWTAPSTLQDDSCADIYWQVDGIESVYLNGQGRVGEDHQQLCGTPPDPIIATLSVHFRDGTQVDYSLSVNTTLWQWPTLVLILDCFVVIGYLNAGWVGRRWRIVTQDARVQRLVQKVPGASTLRSLTERLMPPTRTDNIGTVLSRQEQPAQIIPSLTGLRFCAAAFVVIAHALPLMMVYSDFSRWENIITGLAAVGMTLFFVLSGFVLFYNYSTTIRQPGGLYAFAVARFARLYPLYFVGICFDLVMKYSSSQLPVAKLEALPYYITLTQSWFYKPIGANALIYQYGLVPQVTWSISTEAFFYLAFPLICVFIRRLKTARQLLAALLIVVTSAFAIITILNLNVTAIHNYGVNVFGPVAVNFQDSFERWVLYFSPYIRIFEFISGCLCAALVMQLHHRTPTATEQRWAAWGMGATLVALVLFHLVLWGMDNTETWHQLLQALHMNIGYAPFVLLTIFFCTRYRNAFVLFLEQPWIILLGEASYSIYIVHFVVINAFRYEAAPITSTTVAVGQAVMLVIALAAIAGLALVSWAVIEKPSRRVLRAMLSVRPTKTLPVMDATGYTSLN